MGLPASRPCPGTVGSARRVHFVRERPRPDDANGSDDVFVRSLQDGGLRAASTGPASRPAAGASHAPSISADGRRVAFLSDAPDLVVGTGGGRDAAHAYVRDLDGAGTALAGFSAGRVPGGGESSTVAISASGAQVAFTDTSADLACHAGPNSETPNAEAPNFADAPEPLYVAPIRTATIPGPVDPSLG